MNPSRCSTPFISWRVPIRNPLSHSTEFFGYWSGVYSCRVFLGECKELLARLGRPGECLAPYAAPGARAWGLLISAELDRQSSANRTGPAGFAQDLSAARASSIAEVTCGESGVISGSNRVMTRPSGPMRNLVKFHLISPPDCGFEDLSVRNW